MIPSRFVMVVSSAAIPAVLLLTASFFVLFTARKAELKGIRAYGYLVAALLVISTVLIVWATVFRTLHPPMAPAVQRMPKMKPAIPQRPAAPEQPAVTPEQPAPEPQQPAMPE